MGKLRLAVSSCLLGNCVRYDGRRQSCGFLRERLANYAELIPLCPETECGLPTPRDPMRLTGNPEQPRLTVIRTGEDKTAVMRDYCDKKIAELRKFPVDGFLLKHGSPSCGPNQVKVFQADSDSIQRGRGFFADAVIKTFPDLPLLDETELADRTSREQFLNRIFCTKRWRDLVESNPTKSALIEYQTRHKYQLMSLAGGAYAELGQLAAAGNLDGYLLKLKEKLQIPPTVGKHVNVLLHFLGYFRYDLTQEEQTEIREAIEAFRNGRLQLAVPLTLLLHQTRRHKKNYLLGQTYWDLLNPLYA